MRYIALIDHFQRVVLALYEDTVLIREEDDVTKTVSWIELEVDCRKEVKGT